MRQVTTERSDMDTQYPYEKLGFFYLGRELDINSYEASDVPLLYKSKSLTTHAAIIGMTGSGKTGLGIGLIEEAILDNIPSIIIDPKGDMGNLLLSFPKLRPDDFQPWIDPAEAAKKEMEPAAYAEKVAKTWKEGLQSWGQPPERISRLRDKTDFTIYTPGSSVGVPVSVLSSFEAPTEEVLRDTDTLNGLVNSTTTSLLTLVGLQSDSLQSKEHILTSSVLLHFWRRGENLTMESLIGNIVNPPFEKVGVFGLDTFYPQSERMALAMNLNNVLASPAFGAWTQGVPLDIQKLLYTDEGKPRTAIFSIAHLNDEERMFFVTMLLNQFIAWMRRQQGTSSLKAMLYMDEIFGFFPPTANPPSKKPMLLLLKQARAFGVGVILATQNPVDLDYKGLSNIGSWFVGRLQTTQDQDRVIEGIVGASDGVLDKKKTRQLLSDMKGRQFLLNSAHLDEPVLFQTRWVLSYLKGPISQSDIKKLMADKIAVVAASAVSHSASPSSRAGSATGESSSHLPIVSEKIDQLYYMSTSQEDGVRFEPWLLASGSVRFYNAKRNIDKVEEHFFKLYLDDDFERTGWDDAEVCDYGMDDCSDNPPSESSFYPLPSSFTRLNDLKGQVKAFSDYLYQEKRLTLFRAKGMTIESEAGESLGDFKVRLSDQLKEKKEEEIEKLQEKYKTKQRRLEDKLDSALARVEKEESDVSAKKTDTMLSFGAAVVGAFFGRKALSASTVTKAARGIRNVGRISKEKQDVRRAQDIVDGIQEDLENLAVEIEEKVSDIDEKFDVDNFEIEEFAIKPRRSDIFDVRMALLWEMVPELPSK